MTDIYKNRWVLLGVSFLLTLILFVFVRADRYQTNPASVFENVSEETTETVSDLPVYITGDMSNYYVQGIPQSVSVKFTGPTNILNQALQSNKLRVVTEDLTKLGTGTHLISLTIENFPKSIHYTISPSRARVTISAVSTKNFPVKVRVEGEENIPKGYELAASTSSPGTVQITGAAEDLSRISEVYARIDLTEQTTASLTKKATIVIVDANGELLNVTAKPATVSVHLDILPLGKKVPVTYNLINTGTGQYDIDPSETEVSLFGDQAVLSSIDQVEGKIDLSGGIKAAMKMNVTLVLPDGVEARPDPLTVTVTPKKSTASTSSQDNDNDRSSSASSS